MKSSRLPVIGYGSGLLLLLGCGGLVLKAGEWPQFRGPTHDGISKEAIRTNWAAVAPSVVWRTQLGPALSSLTIAGGRVFTMVRRVSGLSNHEFCVALDAGTGAELWASAPLGIASYPDGGVGTDDGPRSTPAFSDNRVYVLTSYLGLFCLSATNGATLWSRDLVAEFGGRIITWQNCSSPLVVNDLVVLNSNGRAGEHLLAFRTSDGSLAWKIGSEALTHASPVRATISGVDQVVFYTQSGLVSLAPSTGKVLWRYGLFYNGISIGASPVVVSNLVYWSAAYGTGAGTVRITASGTNQTAALAWQKPGALQNHWGTPVHLNGYLYGIYGQSLTTLKCVELATGTEKWSRGGVGFGNVLAVGGNILTLTDTGELILSSPDPQSYTEIATFRPLTGKCWNSAGINNGRIFVRSSLEAVCVDVSLPAPPPLEMQSELAEDGALFRIRVANRDGSAIQAERITRIGIYSHDDLSVPAAGWTPVAGAPVLIDGKLEYAEPVETGKPIRVYRVEEQP